jgi:hypothetical protein
LNRHVVKWGRADTLFSHTRHTYIVEAPCMAFLDFHLSKGLLTFECSCIYCIGWRYKILNLLHMR